MLLVLIVVIPYGGFRFVMTKEEEKTHETQDQLWEEMLTEAFGGAIDLQKRWNLTRKP